MDDELPEALGYLRQATHQLLRNPDPTGQALRLATQILDLENLLAELGTDPALAPGSTSVADSLKAASLLLGRVAHVVPPEVWPELRVLLAQAGDHGHR